MTPPKFLNAEGRAFYRRHLAHCEANGSLTPETADAYALMQRAERRSHPDFSVRASRASQ